tara:strand:- start:36 stop:1634 length:1599 start_codon:yes stop_codon:yes gene_type:complete
MSIAALKEWGGDLTNMLSDAIIDDLQNASLITLTITTDGIAKSMHRTLSSPMIKVRGTIPTEKQIANAVKKYESFIVAECKKIVPSYPANVSGKLSSGLFIVLWTGSGKNLKLSIGGKQFKTFKDVERYAVPELKEIFFKVLKKHFGPKGSNKSYVSSERRRLNVDSIVTSRDTKSQAGLASWRQEFSLSHKPGSTRAQQGALSLKDQTAEKKRHAQDMADFSLPGKESYEQGKADFYGLMEQRLANWISPAMKSKVSSVNKPITLADGTRLKVQGVAHLEVELDDREFQKAAHAKFDFKRLGNVLQKALARESKILTKKLNNSKKFSEEWWHLSGSPSRKEVWESATTEQVMRTLTRTKHVRIKKKTKLKKPKAGKGTAKKKTTPRKGGKSRKRPNTNWGKGPRTKSGRPDMRYKVNKEAWGAKGGVSHSPIALIQLLNKALPDELKKNMTGVYPRSLEWRTGRFGQSAEVTSIVPFPNLTQIQYTYMKNPYEVFEDQGGRDPRLIIGGTIRELAQSIMGTRFGLVRTKRV